MLSFIAKNKNDIIYVSLLLFSVAVGPYFRRIKDVNLKKWVGSFLGLLLIVIVSGANALHPILSAFIGIIAIKIASVR